jgi:ribokinase
MTVDVVCAGAPFLDLIFRGVQQMPVAGEEVLASDLVIVPGAMANVAFALRQLGLDAVVCAPIGTDPAGRFLKELMDDAGIPWLGGVTTATPVSVGLPIDGERAFVTLHPNSTIDVHAISLMSPRAVVANLPLPIGMPVGRHVYGVVGDPQVAMLLDRPPESWADLRALFLNEREALNLSAKTDAVAAARDLAERGCLVVVTLGSDGSLAASPDGWVVESKGLPVVALDTVGAGDLFTAAYIWADLAGKPLEDRLTIASSYAAHSLVAPGSRQKGLDLGAFREVARSTTRSERWMLEV